MLEIGLLPQTTPSQALSASGPGFSVALNGLIDTAFYSRVAEDARGVTAAVTLDAGAGSPALSYQWATLESGDIPGATAASLTVDAAAYDGQTLVCRVTADGLGTRVSDMATIRQAPPVLIAPPQDEIFDEGSGDQLIPLAGVFGGAALGITLPVDGGIAGYDSNSEAVVIATASASTGISLTLRATNTGGFVETSFVVTIEATGSNLSVVFDPLTAAGTGGVPVTGSSITSGDALGHWQVSGGMLSPTPAGDAADLNAGPYALTLDDGQQIDVQVSPHPMDESHWALSGPRADGVDIVVHGLPDDSGTAIQSLEMRVNSGGWQPIGGAAPGMYSITGLAPESSYRVELRASNGAAGGGIAQGVTTVPGDPRGFRGWDAQVDLGTLGDLHVAPWGDDANAGTETQPLRTIAAATGQASPGDTIKLRAGTYREVVTVPGDVALEGYGLEKPRLTAANPLPGLTRCDATDAGAIGAVLGVANSPVFKTTLPLSAIADAGTEPLDLNLHEAGGRLSLAMERADGSDPWRFKDEATFHQADSFGSVAGGELEYIEDADILNASRFTAAQLLAAKAIVYVTPNVVTTRDIVTVDLGTHRITLSGSPLYQQSSNVGDWRYALFNIPPALKPGEFAVTDDGVDMTVYVYPRDPANIDLIEYTAREDLMVFGLQQNNCTVRGLHLCQTVSVGTQTGVMVGQYANIATSQSGHRVEHCLLTGLGGLVASAPRALHFTNVNDSVVTRCTFYDHQGRGSYFMGFGGLRPTGNLVSRNHFEKITGASHYGFDVGDHVEAHNFNRGNGIEAHANKSNYYGPSTGSDGLLSWGNEYVDCGGYITPQQCSSASFAFNWANNAPHDTDRRLLTDQNFNLTKPVANSSGYVFNNTFVPDLSVPTADQLAMSLFYAGNDIVYSICNNIADGMSTAADFAQTGDVAPDLAAFSGNVATRLKSNQTASHYTGPENVYQPDYAQVWANAGAGDYTPVAGGPILTLPGRDMSAEVALLATRFTQFTDFDRDYQDQPIDWALRPVGADAALPFERGATGSGLTRAAHDLFADTAYRSAGQAYDPMTYTPTGSGNDLLVAVGVMTGAGAANNLSVSWRGQTLPALFVRSFSAGSIQTDVVALYRAPGGAGSGAGDLVVTPLGGDSRAIAVAFLEYENLNATAIPGAQVVQAEQTSTAGTSVSATLAGVAAGHTVLALTAIAGGGGTLTTGGSDLTEIPGGRITSDIGAPLSDITFQVQSLDVAPGGAVTGLTGYDAPASSVMVLVELQPS